MIGSDRSATDLDLRDTDREEIEARVTARRRWINEGMATVDQPYPRIAAALVGSDYARESN